MRKDEDIPWAQRAADEANERGIRLAHQCHTKSLFETIDGTLDVLRRIGRSNFGLTYEPANLELCGEPYGLETIKRFAPHIINVYLQNHRIHPAGQSRILTWRRGEIPFDQIPMWEPGGIDFPSVMGALAEIGYVTTSPCTRRLSANRRKTPPTARATCARSPRSSRP